MNTREKRIRFTIICLVEVIILAVLMLAFFYQQRNNQIIETSIEDWQSGCSIYEDGKWKIDSDTSQGAVDMLFGPYITMEKGTYTIDIWYHTELNQSCTVYANEGKDVYLKGGEVILSKGKRHVTFHTEVLEDIDNFEVVVKFNGYGSMTIENIVIKENSVAIRRVIVYVLIIFMLVDMWFIFGAYIKENKKTIVSILAIALITSIPLFVKGINKGHDLLFHLMRIEGIAEEILLGNLPVHMSSAWLDGYGYPVSVYYADLLLYIPAFFRLAGFSVILAYKLYVLLVNLGTSVITYICFKGIFKEKNKKIAMFACFVYMTSAYRLLNVYVRAAVGEFTAMMFFPVIALAIYRIYTEDCMNWKAYKKNALILMLGMTGLFGTHILSTEMVIVVLILVCVLFLKKTFRKNTLRVYLRAIIGTVLLNLYYVVPFLDYYVNVDVIANGNVEITRTLQKYGAFVGQYFSFFQDLYGKRSDNVAERMQLTPGLVLVVALIVAIVYIVNNKKDKQLEVYVGFSVLLLFIASDLFPWDSLALHSKLGNFLAQVQFPWRYIAVATLFMTLLSGRLIYLLQEKYPGQVMKYVYVTLAAGLVMISYFTSNYFEGADIVDYYDTAEVASNSVGAGEYLLTDTDIYALHGQIVQENAEEIFILERVGSEMSFYVKNGVGESMIEVPLFNYKGYHVVDELGNELKIMNGKNNVIRFKVPAGYDGNIHIAYKEPMYWRVAEIVSLLTALGMIVAGGYLYILKRKGRMEKN